MDLSDLKKVLAGFSVAALIAGGLSLTACKDRGESW